ncbi:hypothetical protein DV735_g2211, partial [Chaetothyriales sp. CBS 134920]
MDKELRERPPQPSRAARPKLINPSSDPEKKRKSGATFKDDDPFEEVYETESSLSGDDPEDSDFGNGNRNRGRRRREDPFLKKARIRRRKLANLRHLPAPEVPEIGEDQGDAEKANLLMKLPLEIRSRIYMMVLVTDAPIIFHLRRGFARSAQLLSTCRAVERDAAPILYGKNAFHFQRIDIVRGRFFDEHWLPIGFKDVRRFLETIGPTNVSYLKYVSILFQDGSRYDHHFAPDAPARLFVHDPVVHHILRILSENSHLQEISLFFRSETNVKRTDYHFLKALCAIRAVTVNIPHRAGMLGPPCSAIQNRLRERLIRIMTAEDESAVIDRKKVKDRVRLYFD